MRGPGARSGGVLHVMDMPSVRDHNETVTGLAATGVHAILTISAPPARKGAARVAPGHPIVPVVHVGVQVRVREGGCMVGWEWQDSEVVLTLSRTHVCHLLGPTAA